MKLGEGCSWSTMGTQKEDYWREIKKLAQFFIIDNELTLAKFTNEMDEKGQVALREAIFNEINQSDWVTQLSQVFMVLHLTHNIGEVSVYFNEKIKAYPDSWENGNLLYQGGVAAMLGDIYEIMIADLTETEKEN